MAAVAIRIERSPVPGVRAPRCSRPAPCQPKNAHRGFARRRGRHRPRLWRASHWNYGRARGCPVRSCVGLAVFGNALGESLAENDWSGRSGQQAAQQPLTTQQQWEGANGNGPLSAPAAAAAFAALSPEQQNQAIVAQAAANGQSVAPTVANATSLGLLNSSDAPVQTPAPAGNAPAQPIGGALGGGGTPTLEDGAYFTYGNGRKINDALIQSAEAKNPIQEYDPNAIPLIPQTGSTGFGAYFSAFDPSTIDALTKTFTILANSASAAANDAGNYVSGVWNDLKPFGSAALQTQLDILSAISGPGNAPVSGSSAPSADANPPWIQRAAVSGYDGILAEAQRLWNAPPAVVGDGFENMGAPVVNAPSLGFPYGEAPSDGGEVFAGYMPSQLTPELKAESAAIVAAFQDPLNASLGAAKALAADLGLGERPAAVLPDVIDVPGQGLTVGVPSGLENLTVGVPRPSNPAQTGGATIFNGALLIGGLALTDGADVEALFQQNSLRVATDAHDLFAQGVADGTISLNPKLPYNLQAGNFMDQQVRAANLALTDELGLDESTVRINQRLYAPGGGYTVPDLYFPQSGNIIDYSYQLKTIYTPQVRNFLSASPNGTITIVPPAQIRPVYTIP